MNWLFIHQNCPGQFAHVARHLADAGHRVVFITQRRRREIPGVRVLEYAPMRQGAGAHAYVRELEAGVENGLAVASLCDSLKRDGFAPDLTIGHNGWGEILYVKDVWPTTPLLGYFEFFYRAAGSDVDFDPEFPPAAGDASLVRTRNAINLLGLDTADWGQTPTAWQRDQYPRRYWNQLSVIHEGIDSAVVRPDPTARVWLKGGLAFSAGDEVVTYSARDLEPYRGFHIFMRAAPEILRRRPRAQIVVVGGDGVSYGRQPAAAPTYRRQLLAELDGRLDPARLHFVGRLPYRQYLAILQISSAHVYLTYPFVLSWSLLEALSAGCIVIGSRTPPVEEVIRDGENGYLVDFFDVDGLADRVEHALEERHRQARVRAAARRTVVEHYDLSAVCLPAYLALLQRLTRPRAALWRDTRAGRTLQ